MNAVHVVANAWSLGAPRDRFTAPALTLGNVVQRQIGAPGSRIARAIRDRMSDVGSVAHCVARGVRQGLAIALRVMARHGGGTVEALGHRPSTFRLPVTPQMVPPSMFASR